MRYYNLITKSSCPFCQEAISLLKDRGEQYIYTDMENCEEALEKAKEQTGYKTVPIIWEASVGDEQFPKVKFIGGCDDLKEHFEGQD